MVDNLQIIGGYVVPLADSVSLTKTAFDIENPQKRKTDFSKSIKVPANQETNQLFENLFDVKVSLMTFNPNVKTSYELVVNGISVIRGFCQLISITETDGLIYYELTAKGAIGNLFKSIGEAKLTDLDFSSLNHTWNRTNIDASWSPTLGEGYVYPMITYGTKADFDVWNVEDFKPALFVKQYIDKIFEDAGYTYSSDFFDSTRFKSLVVPQNTETNLLSDSTIEGRQFLVSRSGNQTGINEGDLSNPSALDIFIFNSSAGNFYLPTSGTYSTVNGSWTAADNGLFSLKGYLITNFDYTEVNSATTTLLNTALNTLSYAYLKVAVVRSRSGTETVVDVLNLSIGDAMQGETITASYNSPTFENGFKSANFEVESGDVITLRFVGITFTYSVFVPFVGTMKFDIDLEDYDLTLQSLSQYGLTVERKAIQKDDTMVLNDTVPKEVYQKDFFNAIIKRFNLYMEYDSTDDKNIIIEPLVDFLETDTIDLTEWVDYSSPKIIKPLGALKAGEFLFKDKEDKDVRNELYQIRKPETYGYKKHEIENDFVTETKVVETIFAPCPLISLPTNERVISSIEFPREVGEVSDETALPKLLYWGGELAVNGSWTLDGTTYNDYPYAGHLDNPFDPEFDLNWSVPEMIFYDTSSGGLADLIYTNKNVFNTYWKDYIEQISSSDSKLLEMSVVLDSHRYDLMSFRKLYFFEGVYWRLLDVTDFDPINPKVTMCRFLKLADVDLFSGEQETVFGGGGVFSNGDLTPTKSSLNPRGGGSERGQTFNNGKNNKNGKQSIQNSDDINSGSGTRQTFSSGSDGAKLLADKSVAINSPDVEIIRSGEAFVNSVFLEKKFVRVLTATEAKSLNTTPIKILQGVRSDEYYRITRGYISMDGAVFTDGSELSIRTETTNSELIESSAAFFGTASNKEIMSRLVEVADFGEGLEIYQSADMGGTGSEVTITIIYQIIRF